MKFPEIAIDYLKWQSHLQFRKRDGKVFLFDQVRKTYLVQTPEEVVRQLTIHYLVEEKGFSRSRIAVEKLLKVNDLSKRFDILVYAGDMKPVLLVECKAPGVSLSQQTFEQIAAYNLSLKVDYLMVTNGRRTYCCRLDYDKQSFEFLADVPAKKEVSS